MQTQIEKNETAAVVDAAKPAKAKRTQAAKPAVEKPAVEKPAKAKTAKPAAKQAQASKAKPSQAAAYSILPQFRPKAGKGLQAHTEAALQLFGLYKKGAKVARRTLSEVIGDTAISYHIKNGSFESPEQGVVALTDMGREAFKARVANLDADLVAEFSALFNTGKAGDKVRAVCGKEIHKFIRPAA